MNGVLNLNNEKDSIPNWKATDGVSDINFDDITFFDGRKDGAEGSSSAEQANENPNRICYLNPNLIENTGTTIPATKFTGNNKTSGVLDVPQNLFVSSITSDQIKNGANNYFYVIPRNSKMPVNVICNYDVQTMDSVLTGKLADKYSLGSLINNTITNQNIFGSANGEYIDIEPGKVYTIRIHLGMNSVKVEAAVTPWDPNEHVANPTLPHNTIGTAQP